MSTTTALRLAGQTFGHLTVLHRAGRIARRSAWLCKCSCGTEITVRSDKLVQNKIRACGKNGHTWVSVRPKSLRLSYPNEYSIWNGMRDRCRNEKTKAYRWYGEKGVKVCRRWNRFEKFLADMGPRPSSEHSIERKDPRGHYEPDNCCWLLINQQGRNKRRSQWVEFKGERRLVCELADEHHIPRGTVWYRLHAGWPIEKALTAIGDRRNMRELIKPTNLPKKALDRIFGS